MENNIQSKMPIIEFNMLFLQKIHKSMILNLSFSNYRSFKGECSFTTEPTASKAKMNNLCEVDTQAEGVKQALKISLIFGANASGKTNIIKFMYGFRRWVLNLGNGVGENIQLYDPFKFDKATAEKPTDFSIEFIVDKVRYKYDLSFDRQQIITEELNYYPKGKVTNLYKRMVDSDANTHSIKFGSSVKSGIKPFKVFKNQLLISKFRSDTPCENITNVAKYFADMVISNGYHEDFNLGVDKEMFKWLSDNPEYKAMLSELLAFADTGMKDFQLEKRSDGLEVKSLHAIYDNGKIGGQADLALKDESFGTRGLFVIGCHILRSLHNGTPFFVDEIDSGLHTYITTLIVDMFRNKRINKHGSQLIFTTHDVNQLNNEFVRKDQVWFVEKDEYGKSELFSLSDFEDVREETPFDKWYMNNKFGGVPTLKSLENLFSDGKE